MLLGLFLRSQVSGLRSRQQRGHNSLLLPAHFIPIYIPEASQRPYLSLATCLLLKLGKDSIISEPETHAHMVDRADPIPVLSWRGSPLIKKSQSGHESLELLERQQDQHHDGSPSEGLSGDLEEYWSKMETIDHVVENDDCMGSAAVENPYPSSPSETDSCNENSAFEDSSPSISTNIQQRTESDEGSSRFSIGKQSYAQDSKVFHDPISRLEEMEGEEGEDVAEYNSDNERIDIDMEHQRDVDFDILSKLGQFGQLDKEEASTAVAEMLRSLDSMQVVLVDIHSCNNQLIIQNYICIAGHDRRWRLNSC